MNRSFVSIETHGTLGAMKAFGSAGGLQETPEWATAPRPRPGARRRMRPRGGFSPSPAGGRKPLESRGCLSYGFQCLESDGHSCDRMFVCDCVSPGLRSTARGCAPGHQGHLVTVRFSASVQPLRGGKGSSPWPTETAAASVPPGRARAFLRHQQPLRTAPGG